MSYRAYSWRTIPRTALSGRRFGPTAPTTNTQLQPAATSGVCRHFRLQQGASECAPTRWVLELTGVARAYRHVLLGRNRLEAS